MPIAYGRFANRPYINVGILWHIPAFFSEHFKIQLYGFCDVSQGFLYRFALRVAAGQCRNLSPETALFGCMNNN